MPDFNVSYLRHWVQSSLVDAGAGTGLIRTEEAGNLVAAPHGVAEGDVGLRIAAVAARGAADGSTFNAIALLQEDVVDRLHGIATDTHIDSRSCSSTGRRQIEVGIGIKVGVPVQVAIGIAVAIEVGIGGALLLGLRLSLPLPLPL